MEIVSRGDKGGTKGLLILIVFTTECKHSTETSTGVINAAECRRRHPSSPHQPYRSSRLSITMMLSLGVKIQMVLHANQITVSVSLFTAGCLAGWLAH